MAQSTERWELCEVRLTTHSGWRLTFWLEAVATGPQGQRVIATRTFHRFASYANLESDGALNHHRTALVNQLLADGWEPLPSAMQPIGKGFGRGVMLPRFRRRVS